MQHNLAGFLYLHGKNSHNNHNNLDAAHVDEWMGFTITFQTLSPSVCVSLLGHHITTNVNLSVTKLERLRGFPSNNNGSGSKRQRFSKCVFLLSPPRCQKQYPASFLWREREKRRGGGLHDFFPPFFSYIFKYFATSYLI